MTGQVFSSVAVRDVFAAYAPQVRDRLLVLRKLIFETAASTPGVGDLEETLKWGQPAYLTVQTGSGSTIRLDAIKAQPGHCALFVHCQTDLAATFRVLYPEVLRIGGDRSILFAPQEPLPEAELRHCIALALTYHAGRRRRARSIPRLA